MGATESSHVVSSRDGEIRGYGHGDVVSWKGIPFAAPPVAEHRFRAPRPPEPWDGVRDGRTFGAMAPQGRDGPIPMDSSIPMDEDCLTLNVWAPTPDGISRPVMVWIHGGAYVLGSSAQRIYNGRNLSRLGEVVVVTVNYRVGALGWLDLSSFDTDGSVFETNLGLRDQIAALTWVRDCIAAFGGDPTNVTVFGESSGGASVTTLMTSPHAEGLFHKAIAQSSPATSVYGPERARTVAQRFLELVDLPAERAEELRTMPVERLVDAAEKLVYEVPEKVPGTLGFAPVVDGDVVPRYPVAAFQKGFSHDVPLIIGSNHDEASVFRLMKSPLMPVTSDTVSTMFEAIAVDHPDLSPARIADILSAYPDLPKSAGALALSRDAGFRMPSLWIAEAHCRRAPTFVYRFDHATPVLRAARIGAGHATELPYVFGNFGTFDRDPTFWLGGRKAAQQVSRRMQRRWVAFAWHGVPAALDGSKHWAPYDERRRTLVIDGRDALVEDPDRELREIWGEKVLGFS
ncbi:MULTISPECIES: carboxylesterase/lipase family protein [unclassified Rhodococcus (in: high G+C Gram-positive bacteria)]|uniref:carboxylesterase/lipase family protein n=1 Tax=unclassified Rhodococcus (in: high G+C Gram-positive bacteria) TaxID=192944 RepID=UPI0004825A48|nr:MULTISPECIES: carboxylesterase/lipase family protein [unclassified Rhodococcus (in: high G+C Gram-positive bacteria)]